MTGIDHLASNAPTWRGSVVAAPTSKLAAWVAERESWTPEQIEDEWLAEMGAKLAFEDVPTEQMVRRAVAIAAERPRDGR